MNSTFRWQWWLEANGLEECDGDGNSRWVRSAQLEEVAGKRMPMTVSEIRILVADDQRNVRGNLKMILEAAGYRVDATGDSEEVLAIERHEIFN